MALDRDVLPSNVKPVSYEISLYNLELSGSFSFQGTVKIKLKIKAASKQIILNAHQLSIHSAEISGTEIESQNVSAISPNERSQRITLTFENEIPTSEAVFLEISYGGTINNAMAGFYRSKYKPIDTPAQSVAKDGEHHLMFSTQFESCDARRAFPCFDEPNLKATFDLSIEIPEDQTALSNMPEKDVVKLDNGRKIVSFARTPIMSTYLLAWAFGDFEYIEALTHRKYNDKRLPIRVYTTKGLKEQGRLGLESAHKIIDYYSEIFGINYPLPKLDLLAVHEFSHNAMENWGLLTYRTTAILFDEENSDSGYKKQVSYVVAHEIAHQWFGNLVTMDWWSDLWLNEGFATWVGWLAIDRFHPEYLVWSQFVADAVQNASQLDSLRGSHPIEVPVKDALEIDQLFDAISYLKGSSVIRMLSNHLGVKTFLTGVSNYLKAHSYGNATTNDLWIALGKASGTDVSKFMDPWIRKIGFPVLTVVEEPGQIGIRQSRFLSTGDVKENEDDTLWWIPLGLRTNPSSTDIRREALTVKEETVRNVNESFYKFNSSQAGFYRTNYPPERLLKLGLSRQSLNIEDKIGLIGDITALVISGQATTASLLTFVGNFKDEQDYAVWAQIVSSLDIVRSIFAGNKFVSAGLQAFTLSLVASATEKIGWIFALDEDFLTGRLRALLIGAAAAAGHKGTVDEAKRLFGAYLSGDRKAIHPSLRVVVFKINISEGGKQAYQAVRQEYNNTTSVDGKEICLQSLGKVRSTDLVEDFLAFQFSDHVAAQDLHSGSFALAKNAEARDKTWSWIKENWNTVENKFSGNTVIMGRYLKGVLKEFASHEIGEDIFSFFQPKNTEGYDRGLNQVYDTVRANANYKERDEQLVLEWLRAHEFIHST